MAEEDNKAVSDIFRKELQNNMQVNTRWSQYANTQAFCFVMAIAVLVLAATTTMICTTNAFVLVAPRPSHHQIFVVHDRRGDFRLLAFKRMPGESEKAYFQRVTAAAADPVAFERLVAEDAKQEEPENLRTNFTETLDGIVGNSTADQPTKRSGYVRVEEWEAEQQRKRKSGDLSWEERVQFDGQRHGDRFAQNEILRRNLKLW